MLKNSIFIHPAGFHIHPEFLRSWPCKHYTQPDGSGLPTSTPAQMACTILHVAATPAALGAEFESRGHIAGRPTHR